MTLTSRWFIFVLALFIYLPAGIFAREVPVSGKSVAGLESLDRLMTDFLTEHHVVGAALAVSRNGRLVYARGFGWADREDKEKVEPSDMFRLASLSKSITSAAVLQLREEGKLKLDDKPFRELAIRPVLPKGGHADPRLGDITVLELLQHRGGFDRTKSSDPMFESVSIAGLCGMNPPAMQEQIIRVACGRPLDFNPGERMAYSNFGYCVLGRVIEQASGQSYPEYVQTHIFATLKVGHFRLGRTLLKDRAPGEVKYYTPDDARGESVFPPVGQQAPTPYGVWCLEAMDSHGGWIASAPDLLKFISAMDHPSTSMILTQSAVDELFKRPPAASGTDKNHPNAKPSVVWYGCGWSVRDVGGGRINTWHTGYFAGTSTLMVRRWDGLDWVVLFNQDCDPAGKNLADQIDPLVHGAVDAVKRWPEGEGRENAWP